MKIRTLELQERRGNCQTEKIVKVHERNGKKEMEGIEIKEVRGRQKESGSRKKATARRCCKRDKEDSGEERKRG